MLADVMRGKGAERNQKIVKNLYKRKKKKRRVDDTTVKMNAKGTK
jgi:hypothetical protein